MLPSCRMVASTAQTADNSSGHKPSACRAFTSPAKSWASSLPWSLQARPCRAQQGWQQGLAPSLALPQLLLRPPTIPLPGQALPPTMCGPGPHLVEVVVGLWFLQGQLLPFRGVQPHQQLVENMEAPLSLGLGGEGLA